MINFNFPFEKELEIYKKLRWIKKNNNLERSSANPRKKSIKLTLQIRILI